jgi:serine/threonine protein kinase/tetratricopeptide (TPR) repeat protein
VDSTRWKQIQDLFAAALERPLADRDAFLRQACAGDEDLYREVTSLLQADSDAHSILDGSAIDAVGIPAELSFEGKRVGAYRIVKQIGVGGMGAVYLAERADGQFEQKVALKLIKRGMDSEEILRRFQSERQILAQLQHPNVARLLDGGMTDDGLPYFTMEYVEGQPIDTYCDSRQLAIGERLHLFQTVCSTVQYAHRNLVVHRDLKPSNIMVTEDGTLKLLDFGISKVLTSADDAAEATRLTRMGMKIMTPEYASPEQVRGEPVTTTSDVYSLGIILYELLTGHRPYKFPTRSPIEIENVIRTTEPRKPSTIVQQTETDEQGTTTSTPELISRTRRTLPDKLRKRLAGDLDNICMKALRKEPEQRYTSADQLLQDITAHLNGQPVSARPATVGYRLQKFVRRHKAGVLTAATVFVVVAGLVAFYTTRLTEERDLAQLEARKAAQVSEFLADLFKVSDPSEARGEKTTARELLERGAQRIESELKDQPEVQATMMAVVGNVYHNLGLYKEATPLLENALAIRRSVFGAEHMDVASSMNDLGILLYHKGKYEDAEFHFRTALEMQRKLSGHPTLDEAKSLTGLGLSLHTKGKAEEAEPVFREALTIRQNLRGPEHIDVAESMNNLAQLLQYKRDFEAAAPLYQQSLAMTRKLLGDENPEVADILSNLAVLNRYKGDYAAAEPLYHETLRIRRKVLGNNHPLVGMTLNNLGVFLNSQGNYGEAEPLLKEAIDIYLTTSGPDVWEVPNARGHYGTCLSKLGRYAQAEGHLLAAHAGLDKFFGPQHRRTQKIVKDLIELYEAWGKPSKAAPYRKLLATE